MPGGKWKSVAIRDDVHAKLAKRAKEQHRSIDNLVDHIIREYLGE